MSNLIVCSTTENASRLGDVMGSLIRSHPSRVVVLVTDKKDNEPIEAEISALCYLGGGGRQICSEHITLSSPPASAQRLAFIARPLLVGDLPTTLWWHTLEAPDPNASLFVALTDLADLVVFDSGCWPLSQEVLRALRWAAQPGWDCEAADLAWTRLRPWGRFLSRELSHEVAPGFLEAIESIEVTYAGSTPSPASTLMGWLASRLGWRLSAVDRVVDGIQASFRTSDRQVQLVLRRSELGSKELERVTLRAGQSAVEIEATDDHRLCVTQTPAGQAGRVAAVPACDLGSLLATQMSARVADKNYQAALEVSIQLLEAACE